MPRYPKLALAAATAMSAALVLTTPVATQAAATPAARHAHSSSYVVLTGGATTLALDPGTAGVLSANHITVAPVSEARATSQGIAFPISGGVVKAGSLAGRINHSGGLSFTAGGKTLTIRDFRINTRRAVLNGYVDQLGARVPVLDLNLRKIRVRVGSGHVRIANVKATLSSTAAGALNSYFGTSLFSGGLTIGKAKVVASAKVLRR